VLIGGGDVTLSRLPGGKQSVNRNAPKVEDLAHQVRDAWQEAGHSEKITSLVVDSTLFGGDSWLDSWSPVDRYGSMPFITALQVDGDRDDPAVEYSPRGEDPIARAASAFVHYLGEDPDAVTVSEDAAPSGTKELGVVYSQPV